MKHNATKGASINLPPSKRTVHGAKATASQASTSSRPTSVKAMHKPPPVVSPVRRFSECQESVRQSLVSVDQANKTNPQCVAVYCEKIFQRFLAEEVTSTEPVRDRGRLRQPAFPRKT